MPRRIAATLSLIAFAICLLIGAFQAENSFSTTVQRALVAMVVTLVVGLVVGAMAQKMLDENLKAEETKSQIQSSKTEGADR
jgi:hypothetical protein